MKKIWKVYPKLTAAVLQDHRVLNMDATGHNFDHTLQVGQIAFSIAEGEYVAKLAGASGLCHNADRLLQRQLSIGQEVSSEDHVKATMVPQEKTIELVRRWLDESGEFNGNESDRIVKAVLGHSGPNLSDGDDVLVALQDADRIVCSMADAVMGTTQFWSKLPIIDPKWLSHDPDAHSYRNPKSVLRHLDCRNDWVNPESKVCVRLPKAWELIRRRVDFINAYGREIEEQRAEIGLWPNYPFEA